MSNTQTDFQTDITPALLEFMCNNHTDLNDCVDFVCNVFDLDATDELIDFVADEFDSFFGNWLTWLQLHFTTVIPTASLMLGMRIASMMIIWLLMIMMHDVMNVTDGMNHVMIANTGESEKKSDESSHFSFHRSTSIFTINSFTHF